MADRKGPGIASPVRLLSGWPMTSGRLPSNILRMDLMVETEFGLLSTQRGVIYGGRHGRPPVIDADIEEIMAIMTLELRSGIRAMQAALKRKRDDYELSYLDDRGES